MQRVTIEIAADGLCAKARVTKGPAQGKAQVQAAIDAALVVHGIAAQVIAELGTRLADVDYEGTVQIAQGTAAQPGIDGRLTFAFKLDASVGELCGDGHIDFHERHLLQPVAQAAEIATIVAPTQGVHGRDVRGRTLPSKPGAPAKFRLGPGASQQADKIVATRAGVLLRSDKALDVVPLYEHRGDVDLHSGNLRTEGSLAISGDVHEGFAASATGNIVVRGAVLSAHVAAGGDVEVQQGIMGLPSTVQAGGNLRCRHATAASLQAGQTATIGDQLAHCEVRAEHIVMRSGRGQAFGGALRARTSIDMNAAGTSEGASTLLAIADLLDERAELAQRASEAARVLRNANRAGGGGGRIAAGKGTRMAVRAEDRSEAERLRLLARQRELLAAACITVHDTVHVGVSVQFGDLVLCIDKPRHATRFRYDPTKHCIHEELLR